MNKDHDVLGEGETADKDNVSSPLHVHGDGETTDKKVKERRNSELHAYNFPFAGAFRGAGWNCQSLFAYGLEFTQKYVMELASKHDFIGLSETRGTEERNATLGNAFSHNHEYFYSDLDQFKGGIGLLVQKSFLRNFFPVIREKDWIVIEQGRVGCLRLRGLAGILHIFVCYFDPSCMTNQVASIKRIAGLISSSAHTLILGDFNFVHSDADHFVKASGKWSMGESKVVDEAWRRQISSKGIVEWGQDMLTCETGITISRIDRVYSSLHTVHSFIDEVTCNVLERRPDLSAHRPISFQVRTLGSQRKGSKCIPACVYNHESFGEEVFAEYQYSLRLAGADPFVHMQLFKDAVHRSSKYIRYKKKRQPPSTTDEKLAVCIAFLRALHRADWTRAFSLRACFTKLSEVPVQVGFASTKAYNDLQEFIVELGHTSTKERIDELKQLRRHLPEHAYHQRKNNILTQLRKLMPGTCGSIAAMKDTRTDEIYTDDENIARLLTDHWQNVFSRKMTDKALRDEWLQRMKEKLKLNLDDLMPTLEDVEYVLSNLPSSSPGPDGIPFCVLGRFKEVLIPVFYNICKCMLNGTADIPEDFNYAFLICLPKSASSRLPDNTDVYEPSCTRPLSVVDATNRVVASILLRALEKRVTDWISPAQRGFLKGRQMLQNILDVDFAAQQISIKSKRGAIVLFDFRAAFPSMSHEFMWDTLSAIGLPSRYIEALKLFYKSNKHFIKVGGRCFPSVEVHSGVRQGCPLSPILFALCADILLREVALVLHNDEVVRAFADDTAAVIEDYVVAIPVLAQLFQQFEKISALSLNISKTMFIPLWSGADFINLQTLIRELCPLWRGVSVDSSGKYLGFVVGPGGVNCSWKKPLDKYIQRSVQWSSMNLGLFYNMKVYRTFISTVLSFIMQLADDHPDLEDSFHKVLRRLAPGPGNWITPADATHLHSSYSFVCSFQDPRWTSLAAKLRVIATMAQDCDQKRRVFEATQIEYGRRPFPEWHKNCFYCVLARSGDLLKQHGITANQVEARRSRSDKNCSFQSAAEVLISEKLGKSYFAEARVRQKLIPWKVTGVPAHLERRVFMNLALLSQWCPPRVMAVYFKSIWCGWVTDVSMKGLRKTQGLGIRPCVLNCGWDDDSVFHYGRCSVYWHFLSLPRSGGLGLPATWRSSNAFLLLDDVRPEDKVRLALGMYALHRTVQYLRHHPDSHAQPIALLKAFLHKAHGGSKSSMLLRPAG